jgi:Na+/citrate or Na+/malate symporter
MSDQSKIFGLSKGVAKPVISGAVGAAMVSIAYGPNAGITWAPVVPRMVTDIIGSGLGPAGAGALLGATASLVCDNAAEQMDWSPEASMASCMAVSGATNLVVFGALHDTGAGNSNSMLKLAAVGAATAITSEFVYQSIANA